MSHYNKLTFQGNLGGDPELRMTPSGKPVCNFSVASTESWKNDKGEKVSRTTWFKCVAWDALAKIVNEYGKKGMPVLVEGRLKPNEQGRPEIFTNQQGVASASYEVTVREIHILSSKEQGAAEDAVTPPAGNEDDIPF